MSLAPPKPSPLAPGFRLDRYELLCPIAQGGMASVWVARMRGKHGFEKLVAVKTILPDYAADPRFERMFLDEARIASQIEHTNVAQVLDLGDEHGVLYLVMEWVDGDALSKLHRALEKTGAPWPLGVLLRIVADASTGLHAAHDLCDREGALLGVVHRDVSPQNILVNSNGVVKVIDFGIAKARDRLAGETSTGFLKGKVQYMAPEQAIGRAIDRRADVWALGAVLYHLVAGKPPFDADNQLATLHLLTSGRPPLPLPSSVPACVAAVVKKALAHDPDQRFATAADLARAIDAAAVEAKATATCADVAAFAAKLVSDRAEARRKAVEVALGAAAERARMEKILVPPSADSSSSGVSGVAGRPIVSLEERPSAKLTVADLPRPATKSSRDLQALASMPLSEASSATLGSAALEAGLPAPTSRRRALIVTALAGAIAIATTALVAWRAGASSVTTSASPPATESVSVAASATASAPASAFAPASASASASISAPASPRAAAPAPARPPLHAPHPHPAPRATPSPRPAATIDDGF